jgi:zinc transporter 7
MIGKLIHYGGFCCWIDTIDGLMRPLPFVVQSLLSTLFVQIVPIFLIYAMNVYLVRSEDSRKYFTNILLAFAMGGLLGDVFFHTLPHLAEETHDHSHSHAEAASHGGHHAHSEESMQLNLVIILGIWCFFLLEKVTQQFFDGGHGHSHGHAHIHEEKSVATPE